MPVEWYLCPYDTYTFDQQRIGRRPAIHRYIPTLPDGLGSDWDEAEILTGHCVVRVDTTAALHAVIQADLDFELIPFPTVPTNLRGRVRNKLRGLGYTTAEIDATAWDTEALLDLVTVGTTAYRARVKVTAPGNQQHLSAHSMIVRVGDFTQLSGRVITLRVESTITTLTEGVEWAASVSNAVTATNIVAALNLVAPAIVTAASVGPKITLSVTGSLVEADPTRPGRQPPHKMASQIRGR